MIAFVCCNVCIMKSANTGIVLFICALQVDIQSVGCNDFFERVNYFTLKSCVGYEKYAGQFGELISCQ